MELIFLGTSGAVSRTDRDNTSLLFNFKKNYFLIDTPGTLVQKFKKINIDYFKINHIFLTHGHPDHIYGLPHFIHSRMFDTSSKVYIYGHKDTLKLAKRLLEIFNLFRNVFPEIKFIPVKASSRISIFERFEFITFKVKHTPQSLGIKIKIPEGRIVFSSDSAYSQELVQETKGADYLIHDCFAPERFFKKYPRLKEVHTSSKTLAKIAKETDVKNLIPIHYSGELNFKIYEIEKELQKEGIINFYIPDDLDKITLFKDKSPLLGDRAE